MKSPTIYQYTKILIKENLRYKIHEATLDFPPENTLYVTSCDTHSLKRSQRVNRPSKNSKIHDLGGKLSSLYQRNKD